MVSLEFHYVRVLGIRYNLETGGMVVLNLQLGYL